MELIALVACVGGSLRRPGMTNAGKARYTPALRPAPGAAATSATGSSCRSSEPPGGRGRPDAGGRGVARVVGEVAGPTAQHQFDAVGQVRVVPVEHGPATLHKHLGHGFQPYLQQRRRGQGSGQAESPEERGCGGHQGKRPDHSRELDYPHRGI